MYSGPLLALVIAIVIWQVISHEPSSPGPSVPQIPCIGCKSSGGLKESVGMGMLWVVAVVMLGLVAGEMEALTGWEVGWEACVDLVLEVMGGGA